jgi:hypothetical protein
MLLGKINKNKEKLFVLSKLYYIGTQLVKLDACTSTYKWVDSPNTRTNKK